MATINSTGTTMQAIAKTYSRSACQAREALPVAAQMDRGVMATSARMETRSSI